MANSLNFHNRNIILKSNILEFKYFVCIKKNKCKKANWFSKKSLQIAEERREVKGKGERERYPTEGTVSENIKER